MEWNVKGRGRGRTLFGNRNMDFDSGGLSKSSQDLRGSLTAKKNQKISSIEVTPRVKRKPNVADARQKLQGQLKVAATLSKPGLKMQQRQKDQKQQRKRGRSLEFSGGNLMVTTREEVRSATVSGGSIQIIAKVGGGRGSVSGEQRDFSPPEKIRRASTPMAGNLTVTTKNQHWREHHTRVQTPVKKLDTSAIFSDTEGDLAVDELKGRLRHGSGGSYRPKAVPRPSQAAIVTKILVTNLHPSVSRQDIQELFGVLGPLRSCKLVRPGTAEVTYTNKQDALTAHARYNNRKLDGQPMLCKLGSTPSSSTPSSRDSTPARGKPLPPLRPAVTPITTPVSIKEHPNSRASRPVVFKVRI